MIIGISGYAGAGKDTAADGLACLPGWQKESLAAPLKKMALAINPFVKIRCLLGLSNVASVTLQSLYETCGHDWEKMKKHDDVRGYLQRLGTEGVRENLGENVWIDNLLKRYDNLPDEINHIVVPDVRFINEAKACDMVIWVSRPGVGPVNGHASDAGSVRDIANYYIDNGSTVEDLHKAVRSAVRSTLGHEVAPEPPRVFEWSPNESYKVADGCFRITSKPRLSILEITDGSDQDCLTADDAEEMAEALSSLAAWMRANG